MYVSRTVYNLAKRQWDETETREKKLNVKFLNKCCLLANDVLQYVYGIRDDLVRMFETELMVLDRRGCG